MKIAYRRREIENYFFFPKRSGKNGTNLFFFICMACVRECVRVYGFVNVQWMRIQHILEWDMRIAWAKAWTHVMLFFFFASFTSLAPFPFCCCAKINFVWWCWWWRMSFLFSVLCFFSLFFFSLFLSFCIAES